jgi:hypothetical protein
LTTSCWRFETLKVIPQNWLNNCESSKSRQSLIMFGYLLSFALDWSWERERDSQHF